MKYVMMSIALLWLICVTGCVSELKSRTAECTWLSPAVYTDADVTYMSDELVRWLVNYEKNYEQNCS